jgi:TonB family protein
MLLLTLAFLGLPLTQALGTEPAVSPGTEPAVSPGTEPSAQASGPLIIPPELVSFVEAPYPAAAMEQALSASVEMTVDLDDKGKVLGASVVTPVGNGFDEAALDAVRQMTFKPATADGKPIPVRIGYVYNFKLEKKVVAGTPEGQTITGRLREKSSRVPVSGAEALLKELDLHRTTDAAGRFSFENVPPGTYSVVISASGYKRLNAEAKVLPDQKLELALAVESTEENPFRTVVIGKKVEAVVAKYTLEQRALETVPGTFGDPIRVIQSLPGVARTPFITGFLIIRGAAPNDSRTFLDGVEIPSLYHFLGGPSVLNPNFLDKINYYPGNYPARYGRATAGIIDLESKDSAVEAVGGEADINLLNTAIYAEAPVGEGYSVRAAVRRSYVDAIIQAAVDTTGEDATVILPIYWDYQLKLDSPSDRDLRWSVFLFGSSDSLVLKTSDPAQDLALNLNAHSGFHQIAGSLTWKKGNYLWSLRPHAGYQFFKFDAASAFVDANIYTTGLRNELLMRLHRNLRLTVGWEGEWLWAVFDGSVPYPKNYYIPGSTVGGLFEDEGTEASYPFERDNHYAFGAVYAEASWRPHPKVELLPGLRGDIFLHPNHAVVSLDPRLVARYDPWKSFTLKGGVGLYSRPPEYQYVDEGFGNPDLGPERALQFSGGFEWMFLAGLSLDAQVFHIIKDGLVTPSDEVTVNDDGTQTPLRYKGQGQGRSTGMELLVKYRPKGPFYGWVSYTLSKTEYQFQPDEAYALSPFDQTHIISAVGSLKLGRGWETGLRYRYVTGNPDTPVNGGALVADKGAFVPLIGGINTVRQPAFQQLDFRVEKTWTFDAWAVSSYIDIQNITNHANTEFKVYDYRFRKSWQVPGIPFFPTLGITGRW